MVYSDGWVERRDRAFRFAADPSDGDLWDLTGTVDKDGLRESVLEVASSSIEDVKKMSNGGMIPDLDLEESPWVEVAVDGDEN